MSAILQDNPRQVRFGAPVNEFDAHGFVRVILRMLGWRAHEFRPADIGVKGRRRLFPRSLHTRTFCEEFDFVDLHCIWNGAAKSQVLSVGFTAIRTTCGSIEHRLDMTRRGNGILRERRLR